MLKSKGKKKQNNDECGIKEGTEASETEDNEESDRRENYRNTTMKAMRGGLARYFKKECCSNNCIK